MLALLKSMKQTLSSMQVPSAIAPTIVVAFCDSASYNFPSVAMRSHRAPCCLGLQAVDLSADHVLLMQHNSSEQLNNFKNAV